jgi:hypothetical protein
VGGAKGVAEELKDKYGSGRPQVGWSNDWYKRKSQRLEQESVLLREEGMGRLAGQSTGEGMNWEGYWAEMKVVTEVETSSPMGGLEENEEGRLKKRRAREQRAEAGHKECGQRARGGKGAAVQPQGSHPTENEQRTGRPDCVEKAELLFLGADVFLSAGAAALAVAAGSCIPAQSGPGDPQVRRH